MKLNLHQSQIQNYMLFGILQYLTDNIPILTSISIKNYNHPLFFNMIRNVLPFPAAELLTNILPL